MVGAFLVVAQGDYSLNFCLQLTGKLDFLFLSQGMEKPSEICAFDFLPEYLEMSWKNWGSSVSFSCSSLFLLAVISLGVRHHAMSRYTVDHLNLGPLTCIVKTLSPLKGESKGKLRLCSKILIIFFC